MGLSARMIGERVKLGPQEVNFLLSRAGLLDGEPGAWRITKTGAHYATETLHERGTGGYSFMNPSWSITTWDESVLDVLDVSDEVKQWARQAAADRRKVLAATRRTAIAAAELSRSGAVGTPSATKAIQGAGTTKAAAGALLLGAAYGVYKAVAFIRTRRPDHTPSRSSPLDSRRPKTLTADTTPGGHAPPEAVRTAH